MVLGEGHGVAEALAVAVAEALVDADADGVADGLAEADADGVAVCVGVALALALAEPDGVAVAAGAQGLLATGVGASSVRFTGVDVFPPPSSKSAAGTTSRPRMTVTTKASAPHSWSQKALDELRIRARRPSRAEVCCAC